MITTPIAHRSEDHMKGHGYVKVERVIVRHTCHEEHQDQQRVVLHANVSLLRAQPLSHYKPFYGHEEELTKGYEVARTRIMSITNSEFTWVLLLLLGGWLWFC